LFAKRSFVDFGWTRQFCLLVTCILLGWSLAPGMVRADDAEVIRFEMLEFKAAKMGNVARTLSEASGVNIVVSPKAADYPITVYLNNVTIDDAIDLIARTNNLFYRLVGKSIYRVMTVEEYQSNLRFTNKQNIRVFELKHPNPVTVGKAIEDLFGGRVEVNVSDDDEDELLISGGGITGSRYGSGSSSNNSSNSSSRNRNQTNDRNYSRNNDSNRFSTNSRRNSNIQVDQLTSDQLSELAITDTTGKLDYSQLSAQIGEEPIYVSVVKQHNLISVRTSDDAALRDIEALIRKLDRPMAQVLLEMELLEVNLTDDFTSLFNWNFLNGPESAGGNPLDVNATTSNQSVLGLGNFTIGGGTAVYQFLNNNLRLQVELLKQDGRINTIATPSVLATNNRESRLFVGTEQPVRVGVDAEVASEDNDTASVLTVETERRNIGTTLLIQPKINDDGSVTLAIVLDASTFVPGSIQQTSVVDGVSVTTALDTVNTNQLEVTVGAKDGLTVAVGGLTQVTINDAEDKVPVLGDIPLVGELFKKRVNNRVKTELVLLITPRILYNQDDINAARERATSKSDHLYFKDNGKTIDQYFDHIRDPENQSQSPLNPQPRPAKKSGSNNN